MLSPFVSQRLHPFLTKWNRQDLHAVKDLIEAGRSRRSLMDSTRWNQAPEPFGTWKEVTPKGEDRHHGMRRAQIMPSSAPGPNRRRDRRRRTDHPFRARLGASVDVWADLAVHYVVT